MERKRIILTTKEGESIELEVKKEPLHKRAWKGLKEGTVKTTKAIYNFVIDHPLITITTVSAISKAAVSIANAKTVSDRKKIKEMDNNIKMCTHYDDRNHISIILNRPLTNAEKIILLKRRAEGEDDISILESFGVLY